MPSLASEVLSSYGYHDIVEEILSHLDWRSALVAGQVCQSMNNVIRTSSALQLILREAFYGLPPGHLHFDRGVFDKYASKGDRLNRMIDVFRRWQRGSPVTVHRMGDASTMYYNVSHGLIVASGQTTSHTSVKWNQPFYHPMPDAHANPSILHGNQWAVFDVRNLRDVEFDPARHVPKWTVKAPHEFSSLHVSRPDGVVLTSRTRLFTKRVDELYQNFLRVDIRCYVLEPTDEFKWEDGATIDAIPYPNAKGVAFKVHLETGPDPLNPNLLFPPCFVTIGPDNTVSTQVLDYNKRHLWNWKTGERILTCEALSHIERTAPLTSQGVVAFGFMVGDPHVAAAEEKGDPEAEISSSITLFDKSGTSLERSITMSFIPWAYNPMFDAAVDTCGKLGTFQVVADNEWSEKRSYHVTVRLDRAFLSKPRVSPCTEVACSANTFYNAVCGYRAITLESIPYSSTQRGTAEHRLYISDYRTNDRFADTVHTSPLGCGPALTVKPKPFTTKCKGIKYRRNRMGGRKIPFEYSDVWNHASISRPEHAAELEMSEWGKEEMTCPRTAVQIGLQEQIVRRVYADAEHLYIWTGADLTILSF